MKTRVEKKRETSKELIMHTFLYEKLCSFGSFCLNCVLYMPCNWVYVYIFVLLLLRRLLLLLFYCFCLNSVCCRVHYNFSLYAFSCLIDIVWNKNTDFETDNEHCTSLLSFSFSFYKNKYCKQSVTMGPNKIDLFLAITIRLFYTLKLNKTKEPNERERLNAYKWIWAQLLGFLFDWNWSLT